MKGKFQPKNPSKYLGNPTNIIYRSKWELDLMIYFDKNDDIVGWGSEELIVPYRSPADNKIHRYFPDFIVKNKKNQTIVIEVKPYQQTQQPKAPKQKNKAFVNEVLTYAINQAKWKAADDYCKDRGYRFQILTEKEIYGK
jgi:hypothetical protein